jgi:hypothetical protein
VPLPHSVVEQLKPIFLQQDQALLFETVTVAVRELSKKPHLMTELRPHVAGSVPWMPLCLATETHPMETHSIYCLFVYRMWRFERLLAPDSHLSVEQKTMLFQWRGAHIPMLLYMDCKKMYADADLELYQTMLFDTPKDKFNPCCSVGVFTADNSLPMMCNNMWGMVLCLLPEAKGMVPRVNNTGDLFWSIIAKLLPGRCLRRGTSVIVEKKWHEIYNIVRWCVAILLLNGYDDRPGTYLSLYKQQEIVSCFIVFGCGLKLVTRDCCNAMRDWFKSSAFAQNLVYLSLQRYMLYQLKLCPVLYDAVKDMYNNIQPGAWTEFEEHVVKMSVLTVNILHSECDSVFNLDKFDLDVQYQYCGAKIPKMCISHKIALKARDFDTELISKDVCENVFIRSQECVAVVQSIISGHDILQILYSLIPPDHPQRETWNAMCEVGHKALFLSKKKQAIEQLKLLLTMDAGLGKRLILLLRACLIGSTHVMKRVSLPLADHLAQVLAMHHRLGQPQPCKPVLGATAAVQLANPQSITDVAASQLQRCVRQRLVAQYWRLELRAFWCPLCGEMQLPPRQRCLYVKQVDGTFKNVCGLARRCKRCDYDRCSKNQPRKRNENKRCRHELFSRMCEETELIPINMLGTALVHENRMILTCTKYVRACLSSYTNLLQVCQSIHSESV